MFKFVALENLVINKDVHYMTVILCKTINTYKEECDINASFIFVMLLSLSTQFSGFIYLLHTKQANKIHGNY